MTTLLLALALVGQAGATPPPQAPNGVVLDRLPQRAGMQASSDRARDYVRQTLAYHQAEPGGDADARAGTPWLILIGPDDATRQVASQLPDELASRVQVARYEPDDPRLERGFREHYPGGTFAILLGPDRTIAWKGLCDLREIVLRIRRLLGIDPEPPLLPFPLPWPKPAPDAPGATTVIMPFAAGVLAGLLLRSLVIGLIRAVVRAGREQLKAIAAEVMADEPEPRQAPAQPRRPGGK